MERRNHKFDLRLCAQTDIMDLNDSFGYVYLRRGIFMAAKTANLYARIEPDVKEQAEKILSALGIPASQDSLYLLPAEL